MRASRTSSCQEICYESLGILLGERKITTMTLIVLFWNSISFRQGKSIFMFYKLLKLGPFQITNQRNNRCYAGTNNKIFNEQFELSLNLFEFFLKPIITYLCVKEVERKLYCIISYSCENQNLIQITYACKISHLTNFN